MIKLTDINKEKFRRVKLNMDAIKAAPLEELNKGNHTAMLVNTLAMMIEVLDNMVKGS